MIKDISKGLLDAVTAINQKSREAFVAEQQAMQAKAMAKQIKMPSPAQGKADKPAHDKAASMAKVKVAESAEGSTPKTPREKELAAMHGHKKKITFGDVLKARGVKMKEETEQIEEMDKSHDNGPFAKEHQAKPTTAAKMKEFAKKALSKAVKTISHGSDEELKKDLRDKMYKEEKEEGAAHENKEKKKPNAFDWKNTPSEIPKKPGELTGHEAKKTDKGVQYTKKPVKENLDTPGNSTHQCAIHVKSEQFGEGRTLTSQHAEPDELGNIAWYDVMFAEGIKRVETKDIEILVTESHMNHTKKKKKAM